LLCNSTVQLENDPASFFPMFRRRETQQSLELSVALTRIELLPCPTPRNFPHVFERGFGAPVTGRSEFAAPRHEPLLRVSKAARSFGKTIAQYTLHFGVPRMQCKRERVRDWIKNVTQLGRSRKVSVEPSLSMVPVNNRRLISDPLDLGNGVPSWVKQFVRGSELPNLAH